MKLSTNSVDWLYSGIIWAAFVGLAVSYSKLYLFHVLVILGLVILLIKNLPKFKIQSLDLKNNWFFLFLLCWFSISLLFVDKKFQGLIGTGQILCGLLIILFWKNIQNKARLINGLAMLFAFHLILGLLEAFTPVRWPISAVSKNIHWFGKTSTPFPDTYADYPTGFFWHPNTACFVVLCTSPFIFESLKIKKWIKVVYLGVVLIFLVKSGAKAQLILFSLYLFISFGFHFKKIMTDRKFIIISSVTLVLCFVFVYLNLNKDQMKELKTSVDVFCNYGSNLMRAINGYELDNIRGEVEERFRYILGAVQQFKSHPFFGLGVGQNHDLVVTVNGAPTSLKSVHHYWLELLMVGGLSLTVPFFIFLLELFIKNFKKFNFAALAALALFCIGVVSISTAIYFLPQWLLYSILSDDESLEYIRGKSI